MTEKEITFSDIRKGDTIQAVHVLQDLEVSLTGVADTQDPFTGDWMTPSGQDITHKTRVQKYTLLDRPKPKLPTETSSIIHITKVKQAFGDFELINQLAFLDADGEWATFAVGGTDYYNPEDILEWNRIAITHVKDN